jgi:ferritin-like metal-binding protein YciE
VPQRAADERLGERRPWPASSMGVAPLSLHRISAAQRRTGLRAEVVSPCRSFSVSTGPGAEISLDTSERKPMTPTRLDEQLTKYLTDAHSIEEQALEQMRSAPKLAGDPEIASAFERHLDETEDHEHQVRARLEARGADPSRFKDLAGRVTGKGFALFAKFQPDTTGKLVAHAYSYEHMELAAYDLLARVAEHAGDSETAAAAMRIGEQERAMAERLAGLFDRAVEVSLREKNADDLQEEVNKYLTDAHAIEAQAIQLLEKGSKLAGSSKLASAYQEHLEETREHQRLIAGRLEARGASPSRIKDAALGLGALNWGAFFAAQPDTPAKLAGFSYAFEHLEIAAYELLSRVARRAGDTETEATAAGILEQERTAAKMVHDLFPAALEAALHEQGVTAHP